MEILHLILMVQARHLQIKNYKKNLTAPTPGFNLLNIALIYLTLMDY